MKRQLTRLLIAESVSNVGWAMTQLALPLVAILGLDAGVSDISGMLLVSGVCPLFGKAIAARVELVASPKSTLIIGNIGRCVILAATFASALFGTLRIREMIAIMGALAVLGALIRPSMRVYLASLADTDEDLVDASKRLARCYVISGAIGAAIGGSVVSWLGAPYALIIDSGSYLFAAVMVMTNRGSRHQSTTSSRDSSKRGQHSLLALGSYMPVPVKRALLIECIASLGLGLSSAAWAVHITSTLLLPPWLQGIASGAGSVFALGGTRYAFGNLTSRRYWNISATTQIAGCITLAGLAGVPAGTPAGVMLVVHQMVSNSLTATRDVSLAAGRIALTDVRCRMRMESAFYVYPLMMSTGGRIAAIPLSCLSSRTIIAVSTIPAIVAGIISLLITRCIIEPVEEG